MDISWRKNGRIRNGHIEELIIGDRRTKNDHIGNGQTGIGHIGEETHHELTYRGET